MTEQTAFTILVNDHIEQIVQRRLERFINNATSLAYAMLDVDEELEAIRAEEKEKLLTLFHYFAGYVKKPRHLFALTLQRMEEAELNSIETGNEYDSGEYDGFSDTEQYETITRNDVTVTLPVKRQSKKFDTIVHSTEGSKIVRDMTQYTHDRYYRSHFPDVARSTPCTLRVVSPESRNRYITLGNPREYDEPQHGCKRQAIQINHKL